jgi:hypothetical protein
MIKTGTFTIQFAADTSRNTQKIPMCMYHLLSRQWINYKIMIDNESILIDDGHHSYHGMIDTHKHVCGADLNHHVVARYWIPSISLCGGHFVIYDNNIAIFTIYGTDNPIISSHIGLLSMSEAQKELLSPIISRGGISLHSILNEHSF